VELFAGFTPTGVRVIDAPGTPRQEWTGMASSAKKKTTLAKRARESKLRERRLDKQAKKDAKKPGDMPMPGNDE
jgi:hypothetical protein